MKYVKMPVPDYIREHIRLVKLLEPSRDARIRREGRKQKRELAEYMRKSGLLKG